MIKTFITFLALIPAIIGAYYTYESFQLEKEEKKIKTMNIQIRQIILENIKNLPKTIRESMPIPFFELKREKTDVIITFGHTYDNTITSSFDDYKPGEYMLYNSPHGLVDISILKNIIIKELEYLAAESYITLEVYGTSDGMPFATPKKYNGEFGDTLRPYYYSYKINSFMHGELIKSETKLDNENLAFLRAYSALTELKKIKNVRFRDTRISTNQFEEVGGKYRKVIVKISFKQAFSDL